MSWASFSAGGRLDFVLAGRPRGSRTTAASCFLRNVAAVGAVPPPLWRLPAFVRIRWPSSLTNRALKIGPPIKLYGPDAYFRQFWVRDTRRALHLGLVLSTARASRRSAVLSSARFAPQPDLGAGASSPPSMMRVDLKKRRDWRQHIIRAGQQDVHLLALTSKFRVRRAVTNPTGPWSVPRSTSRFRSG
jgi:hypothetical protein